MDISDVTVLYLDCSAGLSGDMAAGALADLLDDDDYLKETLSFLDRHGYRMRIDRVMKHGVLCRQFSAAPKEQAYAERGHHHRTLKEVRELIAEASLTPAARRLAYHIYDIIAEAEASAHGLPADEVHFHEVASLSSIADVLAFSACYDRLGITYTAIPSLWEGKGSVRCDHGIIPVPVPAVRNILKLSGLPLKTAETEGEILTPTGAAIAAAVRTEEKAPEGFAAVKKGFGAGTRETGLRGYAEAVLMRPDGKEHG